MARGLGVGHLGGLDTVVVVASKTAINNNNSNKVERQGIHLWGFIVRSKSIAECAWRVYAIIRR